MQLEEVFKLQLRLTHSIYAILLKVKQIILPHVKTTPSQWKIRGVHPRPSAIYSQQIYMEWPGIEPGLWGWQSSDYGLCYVFFILCGITATASLLKGLYNYCRYQWPCGLRRGTEVARLRVLYLLSGRGLCVRPITRPEESHRVWSTNLTGET